MYNNITYLRLLTYLPVVYRHAHSRPVLNPQLCILPMTNI